MYQKAHEYPGRVGECHRRAPYSHPGEALMRRLTILVAVVLACGCGKKRLPQPAQDTAAPVEAPAASTEPSERDTLLTTLKTKQGDTRRKAAEALAELAESDPTVLDALVELLKDKHTSGPGKTHPTQTTSTREAAALALLWAGPPGEAALKDKGFSALREGLSDKDPAIREHTAHTVGVLGPLAKPLVGSVQRLCSDSDTNVREAAFDTVRALGPADVTGIAALLTNENPEIRQRAAEVIAALPDVPGDAVPSLTRALDDEVEFIRVAAATGIATAGGKGGSNATGEKLAGAIKKSYPEMFDSTKPARLDGPEFIYWRAMVVLGKPAVAPTTALLSHPNPIVRYFAARTLAELGPDAKAAADALNSALSDSIANVSLEAACTLCRLGEKPDESVKLVRAALASASPGVAAAAIDTIARMGPVGKPLIPDALAKLASPLPDARYAAVALVGTLNPADAAKQVPELIKLLADPEPLIRGQVAAVLESLGPTAAQAAEALGKAITADTEGLLRDQFVEALIAMGPAAKPAVPGLLPLITNASATVDSRVKVIEAVTVADPASPDVAAALVKAASDPNLSIRKAAGLALGKLDPLSDAARDALVKLARKDTEVYVRRAAVRGLVSAGPRAKAARTDLEAIATGKLPGLDLWAKVALAGIDGDVRRAAGAVRDGLGSKSGTNVRTAAAEALLVVGPMSADVPALMKLLKDPGANGAAAVALGRIGPEAKPAVPHLIELLNDRDGEVRGAAAEALGRIGPSALPAATKLRTMTRSDPLVAPTARKALERLGVKEKT